MSGSRNEYQDLRCTTMFRLIASDVDGTLLSGDVSNPITERTRRSLELASEAGLIVTLVSARPPRSLKRVVKSTGVGAIGICLNGAVVYDFDRDVVLQKWPLDVAFVRNLAVRIRQHVPGISFHWEKELGFGQEPQYVAGARPLEEEELSMRVLCDVLDETEPIAKLLARHADHDSETLSRILEEVLEDSVVVTISDPPPSRIIEISAGGVTKASALAWVCEQHGVRPEEVIAFGDMTNDIPMLAWAGHAVAVGNAHNAVKEVADEIAPPNTEDGVAFVLERILRGDSAASM